jgi:hypothetical protein
VSELRYFAYGSNLLPARLAERTPSCRPVGAASVAGFELTFDKIGRDGSGKCTLRMAHAAARVWGAVYALDHAELGLLDAAEGAGYERVLLGTETGDDVVTYVARESWLRPGLAPFDWYHALVVHGARAHRLPPHWLDRLGRWRPLPDPDTERADLHRRLVTPTDRAG